MAEYGELELGPNVTAVRLMGVRLIAGSVPREVRTELNAAVKAGKLGHLRKEGLLPEAYFHPNSRAKALETRHQKAHAGIAAIQVVCGRDRYLDGAVSDDE